MKFICFESEKETDLICFELIVQINISKMDDYSRSCLKIEAPEDLYVIFCIFRSEEQFCFYVDGQTAESIKKFMIDETANFLTVECFLKNKVRC